MKIKTKMESPTVSIILGGKKKISHCMERGATILEGSLVCSCKVKHSLVYVPAILDIHSRKAFACEPQKTCVECALNIPDGSRDLDRSSEPRGQDLS